MTESGQGLQVVKVEDDHSYKLDEGALEQILLRKDIRDLPVVVVSVAGAYRGGKSFLLNFFLRYLTSSQSSLSNGTWLGVAGEPLTGFSWRGGSEGNTTGMLMWSEPFIRTLPSGDKVAVLLLDTQGTFDSSSTIRDCSTIFALSTLISSVQIYNLSQNIQEDDLQHLQLFTEYGRLIKEETGEAFQVLEFLIRDWQNPWEHPYGAVGGRALLEKRLKIKNDQPKELQELRQHIRSSFETVSCFLMPHPGFAVLNPAFQGDINEIAPDFREALLQLVPSIFRPDNLIPKIMNGQRVKARELFTYFRTFMNIFNSDKIPTPTSIMKATTEAGLLTATMEAREQYEVDMERACGEGQPSVPAPALQEIHRNALEAARATFTNKKKMGSKQDADKYLSKLTKDLDGHLSTYMSLNLAKIQKAIITANETYEEQIRNLSKNQLLCLHPYDLEKVHNDAVAAALRVFDARRKQSLNMKDAERAAFIESFKKRYELLRLTNDQNNKMIASEIRMEYWSHMETICNKDPPLSTSEFKRKHEEALAKALEDFKAKRTLADSYTDDIYKFTLIKNLTNHFKLLEMNNNRKLEVINRAKIYTQWKPTPRPRPTPRPPSPPSSSCIIL